MADQFNPDERVQEMVKAIRYKSNFIVDNLSSQAKEAFDQEYNKILDQEKARILSKMQEDKAKYASDKKIEKSRLFNELRLSKMSSKFSFLETLKVEVRKELEKKLKNPSEYRKLMKNLIIQAMVKLMEPIVELECLKQDVDIVEGLVKECQDEFNSLILKECKRTMDSQIKVNKDHYLDAKHKNFKCKLKQIIKRLGGIVLSCFDGRIICSNTIDSRVNFAFQEMLPEIREGLYPQPEKKAHDIKRKIEQIQAQFAAATKKHN